MERNYKVQILRALSICAVILIHTCPSGMWQVVCRPFINFGVATFLFLSGYLTKIENEDWLAFYKKRILKVIIPYIVWSIIYSLYRHCNFKSLIFNLITTESSPVLYYIYVYIQLMILTPLLGKFIKSRYNWIGWIVTPISIILYQIYWLASGKAPNYFFMLAWHVCYLGWFIYYYFGLMLGNKIMTINFKPKKLIVLFFISIVFQMGEGYAWLLLGNKNCGTQLKITSIITCTLFILLAYAFLTNNTINIKNKLLLLIGDCSFGIYLSHMLIRGILVHIPVYASIPYFFNSFIVLVLSLACVVIGKKICGHHISQWLGLN